MMKSDAQELGQLIKGMRAAYARGDNMMAWARSNSTQRINSVLSTLISYDLQAGSYVASVRNDPDYSRRWCAQLAGLIRPYVESGDTVLEVGVGEATTLAGTIPAIGVKDLTALGFDLSWSRIKVARNWVEENKVNARLFVGDIFHIPLADNSINVVYTSHSLEPNGGQEDVAITELLRVANKAVVMVEPIYELANEESRNRMVDHGYVRGLKSTAEKLGALVVEYGLLEVCNNHLNPTGVVLVTKPNSVPVKGTESGAWQCPLTGTPLRDEGDLFYASEVGIAYPVMRDIPLLRPGHAVVAAKLS